jgi:hypothetical protein
MTGFDEALGRGKVLPIGSTALRAWRIVPCLSGIIRHSAIGIQLRSEYQAMPNPLSSVCTMFCLRLVWNAARNKGGGADGKGNRCS